MPRHHLIRGRGSRGESRRLVLLPLARGSSSMFTCTDNQSLRDSRFFGTTRRCGGLCLVTVSSCRVESPGDLTRVTVDLRNHHGNPRRDSRWLSREGSAEQDGSAGRYRAYPSSCVRTATGWRLERWCNVCVNPQNDDCVPKRIPVPWRGPSAPVLRHWQ